MRMFLFVVLFILLAGIGILVLENREATTFRYFGQTLSCSRALQIAVIYLLGVVSGGFVIGFGRRLFRETA